MLLRFVKLRCELLWWNWCVSRLAPPPPVLQARADVKKEFYISGKKKVLYSYLPKR